MDGIGKSRDGEHEYEEIRADSEVIEILRNGWNRRESRLGAWLLRNPSKLELMDSESARLETGSVNESLSGGDRDPSHDPSSTKLELGWRAWASKKWTNPLVRPAAFRRGFAGVLYIGKVWWFILRSRGLYPKTYGRVLGRGPAGTQPCRGILELLL